MFNKLIWSLCIAMEALLLFRGMRTGLLKRYPLFYGYIACVLTKDLLSIPIYEEIRPVYAAFYYTAELLLAAIGYGILAEIYNRSLKNYPGVARFFRIFFAVAFFAVVIKVGMGAFGTGSAPFGRLVAGLEQHFRQLQAVLLSCLLVLFMYYRVGIGKNLRGLVAGYSLLVGSEVITLTFALHLAAGFSRFMREAEPAFYAASLFIWLVALWAAQPEPVPAASCGIERDYARLAGATRMMLLRARAQIGRSVRA